MDHETINRLVDFWRITFFIEPILISTFIFCFVVALVYHYREKARIYFLFYFLSGLFLFTLSSPLLIQKIFIGKEQIITSEVANTIFELTEFIAFYYFFKKTLRIKRSKKMLAFFLISLLVISSGYFTALSFPAYTLKNIREHSLFINVIEFFFLFIMCLAYFIELFNDVPKMNIFKRPSFLIVTSTFFYSTLMIPFFMVANALLRINNSTYNVLFIVHFILLFIMLITISKAFLCKVPITI